MAIYPVGQAPWETKGTKSFAVGAAPWEQEEPEVAAPNYFQRVGSEYARAGQNIKTGIQEGAAALQAGTAKGTLRGQLEAAGGLVRTGLRTVGGIAGATFAPILEAPVVKPLTEAIARKVTQIPLAQGLIKEATNLSQKYPDTAKDMFDIVNIATLGIPVAGKPLAREVGAVGRDIAAGARAVVTPSEEAVQKKVLSLFQKSIKPTAKKTPQKAIKYENDVLTALRKIKENEVNLNIEDATGEIISGRAPQTISELAQGLEQTKKTVFNEYDAVAKRAGTAGAVVDAKPIADEVAKVAQNKAIQLTSPGTVSYAEQWAERLRGFDVLDAETTQEVIQMMNTNLQSFYKNPTYDAASRVTIDAGIANNFRKALDTAIESATGEQYQVLKRQYGALKEIENDVVRAAMRDARKNTRGLLDYSDMFTGGQMVGGILSLNPAMFTKGAIERGIKEYIKFLNDPNRAIKNIFDKITTGTSEAFTPRSKTGQALQRLQSTKSATKKPINSKSSIKPTVSQSGGKVNPLVAEARKYKSAEEFVKAKANASHGTDANFTVFDATKAGEKGTLYGKGTYLTNSAKEAARHGKNVKSVYIDKSSILQADQPLTPNQVTNLKKILGDYWDWSKPHTGDELYNRIQLTHKNPEAVLQKAGINGVEYAPTVKGGANYKNVVAFNTKPLLTDSQLTDIWKKAHGMK